MPKLLSQNVPILFSKISLLSGHRVYILITTVTKGLGIPNFEGLLLVSIRNDSKWILGIIREKFIFVHFIHSGNQGPGGVLISVIGPKLYSYLSHRIELRPHDTCLHDQIKMSQFFTKFRIHQLQRRSSQKCSKNAAKTQPMWFFCDFFATKCDFALNGPILLQYRF